MADRYAGLDDVTDVDQVVRYLVDNYVDGDGERLRQAVALSLCQHDLAWEWIQNGVANRSYVYYIGDMIADHAGLPELLDDDDDDDDDENDDENDDEENDVD